MMKPIQERDRRSSFKKFAEKMMRNLPQSKIYFGLKKKRYLKCQMRQTKDQLGLKIILLLPFKRQTNKNLKMGTLGKRICFKAKVLRPKIQFRVEQM